MHGEPLYGPTFTHFAYVNPQAPKGGALRLAALGTFDNLNPFILKGTASVGREHVFETLLKRSADEPFTLYGLLAESIEISSDRRLATFRLRVAHFQEGSPVTAADVIYSFETLRDHGRPNHRLYYANVAEAHRLDDRTVRFVFRTDASNREMPLIIGLMPILSRRYYTEHEFEKTTLDPPPGSGPYRVERIEPGRSIIYRRDPQYWGRELAVNRGQNNFDEIRIDYFRDSNSLFEAFKAEQFDLYFESSASRWANGYSFPARREGRILRDELAHRRPFGMSGFVFNARRPPYNNSTVREALTSAFDFEWVNRRFFHDAFVRSVSYFSNSELAASGPPTDAELWLLRPWRDLLPPETFGEPVSPPSTDGSGNMRDALARATALLRSAGWSTHDGTLVDSGGRPFSFEVLLQSNEELRVASAFARNLERLGIRVRLRVVDSAQHQLRRQNFDFDMVAHHWGVSDSPGNELAFYWGSGAATQPGSRNYMGVKDPAVDALIVAMTNAGDRANLVAAARALDRVLRAGRYVVPLYHSTVDWVAYSRSIKWPSQIPSVGLILETMWAENGR